MQTFKIRLNRIGNHYPGRPCLGCRVLLSVVPTCWLLLSMWYVTPLGQHSSSYRNRRLSRGIDGCYARRGRLQLLTRFISYVMRAERFFPLRRLVSSARVTRADKLLHNPHLLVVKGHSLGLLRVYQLDTFSDLVLNGFRVRISVSGAAFVGAFWGWPGGFCGRSPPGLCKHSRQLLAYLKCPGLSLSLQ